MGSCSCSCGAGLNESMEEGKAATSQAGVGFFARFQLCSGWEGLAGGQAGERGLFIPSPSPVSVSLHIC